MNKRGYAPSGHRVYNHKLPRKSVALAQGFRSRAEIEVKGREQKGAAVHVKTKGKKSSVQSSRLLSMVPNTGDIKTPRRERVKSAERLSCAGCFEAIAEEQRNPFYLPMPGRKN